MLSAADLEEGLLFTTNSLQGFRLATLGTTTAIDADAQKIFLELKAQYERLLP